MMDGTYERAVVAFARTDAHLYAATSRGLLRSSDAGQTWLEAGLAGVMIQSLAVIDLPGEDTLFLAGVEDGVMRLDDGGRSWSLPLTGSPALALVAAEADDGSDVALAGTETDGIVRSDDAGQTWKGANAGLLDFEVLALTRSPAFHRDKTAFAGTASGLYRTRNGGHAWRWLPLGLPSEPAVQSLALPPDFDATGLVLAGTEADGLLRSSDGGTTWEQIETMRDIGVTALVWSHQNASRAWAATDVGLLRSDDAGQTWMLVNDLQPVLSLLTVPTEQGETVLAGLASGAIMQSSDEGSTFLPSTILS